MSSSADKLIQGIFLCTLKVCTLGFWVPKPWNMALNKGIWDPKLRGTNIKGTNLTSLTHHTGVPESCLSLNPSCCGGQGLVNLLLTCKSHTMSPAVPIFSLLNKSC